MLIRIMSQGIHPEDVTLKFKNPLMEINGFKFLSLKFFGSTTIPELFDVVESTPKEKMPGGLREHKNFRKKMFLQTN